MFLLFLPLFRVPRLVALSLVLMAGHAAAQGQEPQGHLPRTRITAGLYQIDAQIAKSEAEREFGLMFRKEMPQAEGMIFVFEQPATQCFWMKNTILPLTAAFIADDGRIVNLADMQPQTENSHCSTEPVRYVLEMNQGWFARKGIKAGSKLGGEVFARH
jgi:uncharacterized protein